MSAASSAITFYELIWAVKKYRSLVDAAISGEAFVNMSGLKLIDVDGDLLAAALDIMHRYQLDPRDSIHAASALSEKAEEIISVDEHFEKLTGIKRRSI